MPGGPPGPPAADGRAFGPEHLGVPGRPRGPPGGVGPGTAESWAVPRQTARPAGPVSALALPRPGRYRGRPRGPPGGVGPGAAEAWAVPRRTARPTVRRGPWRCRGLGGAEADRAASRAVPALALPKPGRLPPGSPGTRAGAECLPRAAGRPEGDGRASPRAPASPPGPQAPSSHGSARAAVQSSTVPGRGSAQRPALGVRRGPGPEGYGSRPGGSHSPSRTDRVEAAHTTRGSLPGRAWPVTRSGPHAPDPSRALRA